MKPALLLRAHAPLVALLLLFASACLAFPSLLTPVTVVNLFNDGCFLGIIALGMTIVVIAGGIDLSVGAVAAASAVACTQLVNSGMSLGSACALVIAAGCTWGVIQGGIIHGCRQPPFLTTLAGMFCARSLGFLISPQSAGLAHDVSPFYLQTTPVMSIFAGGILFIVLAIIMHCALRATAWGKAVFALGNDESVSRQMGVPVGRIRISTYALSGSLAAVGGVVYAIYTQSGDPTALSGFELDVLAAVVLGGTSLQGGIGSAVATIYGTMILGLIQTVITIKGDISSWWSKIAVASMMLVFILAQMALARGRSSR